MTSADLPYSFIGLILIPLSEKASEHLTAINEAFDNRVNSAILHVISATVQTVFLNIPIAILVGWITKRHLALSFDPFEAGILLLSIIVVASFLKAERGNYLKGFLYLTLYAMCAIAAFFFPLAYEFK